MVAIHFVHNDVPADKIIADHIDNNKQNNNADNLRWVTYSQNTKNFYEKYKVYKKNPIIQLDKNNKIIKEWENLHSIIKKNKRYKKDTIRKCLNKVHKITYGFVWKYKNKQKHEYVLKHDEEFKNIGRFFKYAYSDYEISNYGTVRNINKGNILKPQITGGYYSVTLKDLISRRYISNRINRLVAYLFVEGRTTENRVVNHIDENKFNNYYKNLEWVTMRQNTIHSVGKKVSQHDKKTGELIKIYNSIADAAKCVNGDDSGIISCCKGKLKTSRGYKWKYA